MRCIKLTLSYDGTDYDGWQIQPNRRTLQASLEQALNVVTGESIRVAASGRTDAGVHALGQVVSFSTNCSLACEVLCRAINANLPHDVAVLRVDEAPEGFHARRDATSKRYRYVIFDEQVRDVFSRRTSWHVPQSLDVEAMHRAAQSLRGTHDFASFSSSGSPRVSTVRTIYDILVRRTTGQRSQVLIEVEANGFLYNMVRAIVGTLVDVGRGAQTEVWPAEVVAAMDRKAAGATAPPQGLFLVYVRYGAN